MSVRRGRRVSAGATEELRVRSVEVDPRWPERDEERLAAVGWLVEAFNSLEFLLHVLIWSVVDGDPGPGAGAAVTERASFAELARLVERLSARALFGNQTERARDLAQRLGPINERRNAYLHAHWAPAFDASDWSKDPEVTLLSVRKFVRLQEDSTNPFDFTDLVDLVREIRGARVIAIRILNVFARIPGAE